MQKLGILINPKAGRVRDLKGLQEQIRRALGDAVEATHLQILGEGGDPFVSARRWVEEGCRAIAVAGGDGSIHQLLPYLVEHSITLGILPLGTVNLLAHEMGIPQDLFSAVQILKRGKTRTIDLGEANGRYFCQVVGAGLDANILRPIQSKWQKRLRAILLPYAGSKAWHETPTQRWTIHYDGQELVEETCGILVANGSFYAGRYRLGPEVSPDDGRLDVFVLPKIPIAAFMRFCAGALTGRDLPARMRHVQASRIEIYPEKDVPVQADGEVVLRTPLKIQLKPGGLRVLAP